MVFQSSNLLNATLKEMWGQEASTVKNVGDLLTLGDTVLSSDKNKEHFMNTLATRIKRTVIRTLDVVLDIPKIFMDYESYFGIMQKINVQPLLTQSDISWNLSESDFKSNIWDINTPTVSQTFFNNTSAFTIPITIPDVMLKSAFRTTEEFDNFVVAIFNSISDSVTMAINASSHLVVSNLIAERIKENKQINLLTEYNTLTDSELTAKEAITDKEFLKYCGFIIRNYIGYMKNPSTLYNDGTIIRATQRDNMHVLMLSDFVSAYTTYYSADTFHNDITQLPYYSEIGFWQNMGNTTPTFETNSTINIIPASEVDADEPVEINEKYVICVLADRQALGTTLIEDWSGVDRNNRNRYTNYTFGANRGYFNDLSENAVVFSLT